MYLFAEIGISCYLTDRCGAGKYCRHLCLSLCLSVYREGGADPLCSDKRPEKGDGLLALPWQAQYLYRHLLNVHAHRSLYQQMMFTYIQKDAYTSVHIIIYMFMYVDDVDLRKLYVLHEIFSFLISSSSSRVLYYDFYWRHYRSSVNNIRK